MVIGAVSMAKVMLTYSLRLAIPMFSPQKWGGEGDMQVKILDTLSYELIHIALYIHSYLTLVSAVDQMKTNKRERVRMGGERKGMGRGGGGEGERELSMTMIELHYRY